MRRTPCRDTLQWEDRTLDASAQPYSEKEKTNLSQGFGIKAWCATEQISSPSSGYLWFLDFKSLDLYHEILLRQKKI